MVDVVDCPGSSWVVGQALVYVGLTLLHLLAPKGPVDPVQKATVKLNHFRQEVGWLMAQQGFVADNPDYCAIVVQSCMTFSFPKFCDG